MNHFDHLIQGWNQGITKIYKTIIDSANNGDHFVEVGCWKGKSAAFMAVEIINSKKKIKFDCVDTWNGSFDEVQHLEDQAVRENKLYEHFLENMTPVIGFYNPIRLSSVEASKLYPDNSLDFVFIDAGHDYDSVRADINAWYPKIKEGKILAGHDIGHPPVYQAVEERFKNFEKTKHCWIVKKNAE